jgi:hypothetical protein
MEEKNIHNFSKAVISLLQISFLVKNASIQMQDPEYLKKLEEIWHENKLFEWTGNMSPEQLRTIKTAVEIELDQRVKQEKLI